MSPDQTLAAHDTVPCLQIRRRPNGARANQVATLDHRSYAVDAPEPAHHLPRPIRRQPHQPAGLAHICLTIPRRTLPVEPPQVPVLAARARRDHELLLRHQPCRRVLEPLRQPVAQDCFERAVTDTDNPRAVDPPPSAAVARRIAARHANRLTQRREHRPDPPPRPARRPPPDRVQLFPSPPPPSAPGSPSTDAAVVARAFGRVVALHRVIRRPEQLPLP